ncbi:MAG: mucin7-like protein [Candidatus Saccharibacteria bacterium]|nr:mucin7-like protein [Candidatus Saccharibacteria bacterium]
MRRLFKIVRTSLLYLAALLLAAGYPLMAMADTPVATPTTDGVDTQTTPPTPPKPTYTYNATTGMWDSNVWQYNPTTGVYEAVPSPVVSPTVTDQTPTSLSGAPADQSASPTSTVTTSITSGVDVNNQVTAGATTGDATVANNTVAGSATTGDAASTATLINTVNSVIAAGDNQKVANFTYNVMGDVTGDIMLYPLLLKSMLESGATGASGASTTVSATQTNTLTNNVNLQATSGNAVVSGNTSAGDATTGSANTVANVMNILNSMISANRSFIGTINIYGSLQGDILIAPDFIPQMIASNQTLQASPADTTTVKTTDTQTIVNNIALAAQSGSAAVLGNTSAGGATSGSANSNVVIFNLSGHAIVAKDSLLVFVNVLGKWVGVIVDAPSGATSAMIGSGVVSDAATKPDLTVTAQSTNAITNNITLTSQSGNAIVQTNTLAGNAMSGNATASANIANISGSQLGISDWFGVLFINVFNSWYGSFGIDTSYGNPPAGSSSADVPPQPGVITFTPRTSGAATNTHKVTVIDSRQLADAAPVDTAVLGATTNSDVSNGGTKLTPQSVAGVKADYRLPIVIGSIFIAGLSGLALRRLLSSKAGAVGIASPEE